MCIRDSVSAIYERIHRCPVPYNMRCVYLPLVWRNYFVSSKPCLNNNQMSYIFILLPMRSIVDSVLMTLVWVIIYVRGWPVPYNFRLCTSPCCGDLTNPQTCCRPGRLYTAKHVVCTCLCTVAMYCYTTCRTLCLPHTSCLPHLGVEKLFFIMLVAVLFV